MSAPEPGGPGSWGIAAALHAVRDRIERAGGDPEAVRIVAATKGHSAAEARAAVAAGLADLGESYAQELVPKAEALLDEPPAAGPPRWHMIGRLQRNKVRSVAPYVTLWQSVDRLSLAAEIARRAPGAPVLVQVSADGDPDRGGAPVRFVASVVEGARDLGLEVAGLMTVAPMGGPEVARTAFASTRALADRLELPVRSMGMSADLEVAVAEGSTMVRVGTALFGPRAQPGPTGPRGAGEAN